MRIAYIAPYQGPTLIEKRPIILNRSMSNRIKIELIAALLQESGHDVEVISQGEVVESRWKLYPGFTEHQRFHPAIPVAYASTLPVRRLNALWSDWHTLRLMLERHRLNPFDIVIIFNLKGPQIACAKYAIRHGIPVIFEYEDDRFVNVMGQRSMGLLARHQHRRYRKLLQSVSACMAVSPHLLAQVPDNVPKMLLRGVIGEDVLKRNELSKSSKRNWVLFSGTHIQSNGIAELIQSWPMAGLSDWELHITGYGVLTEQLRRMAEGVPGITFHGLVERERLVELMSSARICINPHAVSQTPGNVFAFKIIEYLGAGAHVITTPMGVLEKEIESGITYMPDNHPATIAETLNKVIASGSWTRAAGSVVGGIYGPDAVAATLNRLIGTAVSREEGTMALGEVARR